jgi:hypothetical protein
LSPYLSALALTLLVEVPIYAVLLPETLECSRRKAIIAAGAVNLATHPAAFLLFVPAARHALGWVGAVTLAEVLVWASETLALWLWLRRQIVLLAVATLIANGLSLAIGVLVLAN